MLKPEQNQALMEVGPGTLMGELLRRYWTPFAPAAEMDATAVKPIRLMGEDLVLYRGTRVAGTDSSTATVPTAARICPTRGWRSAASAATITGGSTTRRARASTSRSRRLPIPMRASRSASRSSRIPLEERAGLLWAYMGPQPVPEVPVWEPFTWGNGFVQIVMSEIPCNWFQCQENSIDPVHFEWLHDNWGQRLRGQTNGRKPPTHLRIAFDEFDYGFQYKRILEGQSEQDELWTVGRTCLWPNCLFTGNHFEWRVPIDDDNTLSVGWFFDRVASRRCEAVQSVAAHPVLVRPDQRRCKTGRWLDFPRHEPGFSWPGSVRARSPTARRSTWANATAASS